MARPKGQPKSGGRQKGTPNKFSGELKDMILRALSTAGGETYLVKQAKDNPNAFMTLVGKVLPLQVGGDPNGVPIAVREIRNYFVTDGAADEA
jgi:hypothetical protein